VSTATTLTLHQRVGKESTQKAYRKKFKELPADQAWFWTAYWTDSVRRSLQQIASGDGTRFDNGEDFRASLDE